MAETKFDVIWIPNPSYQSKVDLKFDRDSIFGSVESDHYRQHVEFFSVKNICEKNHELQFFHVTFKN